MKIFKIQFLIFTLFLFFISCVDKNNEEVLIRYVDHNVYVTDRTGDGEIPPIYQINFKIKNISNQTKVFFAKVNSYDKSLSEFYLIDTIQNIKVPLYIGGSIHIMKPNKEYNIYTDIKIRDFKSYFKLPESFFEKRIDFSSDKILLEKLLVNMMNSSTIHYKQDTSDVYPYRLFDKDVQELENKHSILVSKPSYIKLNE